MNRKSQPGKNQDVRQRIVWIHRHRTGKVRRKRTDRFTSGKEQKLVARQ